jgi:hypothetical protein
VHSRWRAGRRRRSIILLHTCCQQGTRRVSAGLHELTKRTIYSSYWPRIVRMRASEYASFCWNVDNEYEALETPARNE